MSTVTSACSRPAKSLPLRPVLLAVEVAAAAVIVEIAEGTAAYRPEGHGPVEDRAPGRLTKRGPTEESGILPLLVVEYKHLERHVNHFVSRFGRAVRRLAW